MTDGGDPSTTSGDQSAQGIAFAAPDITEDEVDAVVRVLRSGWLTTGEECEALEHELAAYLGGSCHVVAMSSCTAALETAFAYLDLPPDGGVGVPAWTFASSALAPMKYGLRPVLLDVDADTLNVDPGSLEAALEAGLQAVVLVHFAGVPVDPQARELCAHYKVPVVEDCAHALGAFDDRGPMAAKGSVAACLSFYATKNLSTGEGGAIVTQDEALAAFGRSYRLHGMSKDAWARNRVGGPAGYDIELPGIKANLPDILAALGRVQLARFDDMQDRRAIVAGWYRSHLAEIPRVRTVPSVPAHGSANHLMAVVLDEGVDRDRLRSGLGARGIPTSVHFPPLTTFTLLRQTALVGPTGVETAITMGPRVMSLPFHSTLSREAVAHVCHSLHEVLSS